MAEWRDIKLLELEARLQALESAAAVGTAEAASTYDEGLRTMAEAISRLESDMRSLQSMMQLANTAHVKATEEVSNNIGFWIRAEKLRLAQWSSDFGRMISETLKQSMGAVLPSSFFEAAKIGKAGESLGSIIGSAAGAAIGYFLGNPALAMILSRTVGAVFGGIMREAEYIITAGRVIGAQMAPVYTGGGAAPTKPEDFTEIGINMIEAIRQVTRAMNVSADTAQKYLTVIARLGVGVKDGSDKLAEFALAAERAPQLFLPEGRVVDIMKTLVTTYGESARDAMTIIGTARTGMLEFMAASTRTGDVLQKSLGRSGDLYVNLLLKVGSAAADTGADLRGLTDVAAGMLKTMGTMGPGGTPAFRPGQMGEIGARIEAGLMPRMPRTWEELTSQSGVRLLMLQYSRLGREYVQDVMAHAPARFKGPPQLDLAGAEIFRLSGGGRRQTTRAAMAMLASIQGAYRQALTETHDPNLAFKRIGPLAEKLGIGPIETEAAMTIIDQFQRDMGIDLSKAKLDVNTDRAWRSWLRHAQKDPTTHEALKQAGLLKNFTATAAAQAERGVGWMTRLARVLDDIRTELTKFWATGKLTMDEVQAGQAVTAETASRMAASPVIASLAAAGAGDPVLDPAGAVTESSKLINQLIPLGTQQPRVQPVPDYIQSRSSKTVDAEQFSLQTRTRGVSVDR